MGSHGAMLFLLVWLLVLLCSGQELSVASDEHRALVSPTPAKPSLCHYSKSLLPSLPCRGPPPTAPPLSSLPLNRKRSDFPSSKGFVPIPVEREEAVIMQKVMMNVLNAIRLLVRTTSTLTRIGGDTLAGVLSSYIRGLGGACNLFAELLRALAHSLRAQRDPVQSTFSTSSSFPSNSTTDSPSSPTMADRVRDFNNQLSDQLIRAAVVLTALSRTLMWGGEITESLTSGLGEALEDSFKGLEMLALSGNKLVVYLLRVSAMKQRRKPVLQIMPPAPPSVPSEHTSPHNESLNGSMEDPPRSSAYSEEAHGTVPANDSERDESRGTPVHSSSGKDSPRSLLPEMPLADEQSKQKRAHRDGIRAAPEASHFAESLARWNHSWTDIWSCTQTRLRQYHEHSMQYVARVVGGDWWLGLPAYMASSPWSLLWFYFPHLLCLCVLALLSLVQACSARIRWLCLVGLCLVAAWQHRSLQRLHVLTSIEAMHSTLQREVSSPLASSDSLSTMSSPLPPPPFSPLPASSSPAPSEPENTEGVGSTGLPDTSPVQWVNTLLSSLWTIKGVSMEDWPSSSSSSSATGEEGGAQTLLSHGGLGPYLSSVYAEMLSTELALIPPSVANLRLKSFSLGSRPPLLRDIKLSWDRNHNCPNHRTKRSTSSVWREATGRNSTLLQQLLRYLRVSPPSPSPSPPHPPPPPSSFSPPLHGEEMVAFTSCDMLLLELDFVFISQDLDVSLSLRAEEWRSALPEVVAVIPRLLLKGRLRFNITLTEDYPFLDQAKMYFWEMPMLDFSVSSGGLEISSIPLVSTGISSAAQWLLQHYTSPQYTTVDMRHLLCTACDAPVATQSLPSYLLVSAQEVREQLRSKWRAAVAAAQRGWAALQVKSLQAWSWLRVEGRQALGQVLRRRSSVRGSASRAGDAPNVEVSPSAL